MDNIRDLKDADLIKTIALPVNAVTVVTASIDLGGAGVALEEVDTVLSTTAATGVDTKVITGVIQDSADNSSFAAISGLGSLTVTATSTGAGGYPASSARFVLPRTTRRYVRAAFTGTALGGTASDGTGELSIRK